MGQTLTHGIYLPDEGERNCYAGLAANWQILDSSVGTIAEHTTQIAGKAPLVHTHTKENVTDLLNSNFIPSANNSYDLGSSSYQWNNLYAKNYFYNGVAWGLDKYNQWTGVNDFNNLIGLNGAELWFKNSHIDDFTTNPAEYGSQSVLQLWNKNTTQYSGGLIDYQMTDGSHIFEIVCFGYPLNDATPHQHRFRFAAHRDGGADFYPIYNNGVNLGTSTNKWKTLNGVNPGGLSLPKGYTEEGADKDYIDIASVIQTLDGTTYSYTLPDNGWIAIRAEIATLVHITIGGWYFGQCITHPTGSTLIAAVPFRKGDTVTLKVAASTLEYARFYPMQGNV